MSTDRDERTGPCAVCGDLPDVSFGLDKAGETVTPLPGKVNDLQVWSGLPDGSSGSYLKRCPACGCFFNVTTSYEYLVNGSEDETVVMRIKDPVELFQILLNHTPLPQFEAVHAQQLALALEDADARIRERVRDFMSGDKKAKAQLRGYAPFACWLVRSALDLEEIVPVLVDAYSVPSQEAPRCLSGHPEGHVPRELPLHLADLAFLEERCRTIGVEAVLKDFDLAISQTCSVPLHPSGVKVTPKILSQLREILSVHRDFLTQHPSLLFQTLYNAAFWRDAPNASHHYRYAMGMWQGRRPWEVEDDERLSRLVEFWRGQVEAIQGRSWARACHPGAHPFGAPLDRVFTGHDEDVADARFAPDDLSVLSWTEKGEWIRWTVADMASTRYRIQTEVSKMVLNRDGSLFATLQPDPHVRVYDLSCRVILKVPKPPSYGLTLQFFDPSLFLVEGFESEIWDLASGAHRAHLPGSRVEISQDGTRAMFRTGDAKTVVVRDLGSGEDILSVGKRSVEDQNLSLGGVMSPDGRWLAAAAPAKAPVIRIFDVDQKKSVKTLRLSLSSRSPELWSFSPDSRFLLASEGGGSGFKTLKVLDWRAGRRVWKHRVKDYVSVRAGFSPDSQRVAVGDMFDGIRVFDLSSGLALCRCHGHRNQLRSLAFRNDGQAIVTAAADRTVRVWDLRMETHLMPKGHEEGAVDVQMSPDGRLALSRSPRDLFLWDLETGQVLLILRGFGSEARFSEGGAQIVTRYSSPSGGFETTWDARTGDVVRRTFFSQDAEVHPEIYDQSPAALKASEVGTEISKPDAPEPLAIVPENLSQAKIAGPFIAGITQDGRVVLYRCSGGQGPLMILSTEDLHTAGDGCMHPHQDMLGDVPAKSPIALHNGAL